jgi:FHS family L-fucose permease-like MFS transporter
MTGAVTTKTGNFHTAMAIPTAFYVLAWVFPVNANTVSRRLLDGHRATELNVSVNPTAMDKNMRLQMERVDSKQGGESVETVGV